MAVARLLAAVRENEPMPPTPLLPSPALEGRTQESDGNRA